MLRDIDGVLLQHKTSFDFQPFFHSHIMAVGKNKRLSKGGKRSTKRKLGDTMLGKEWYDVVAPQTFNKRQIAKTIANKSKGTYHAADSLKGRSVLTNFHGMSLTTDKLRSLLQKWCTLIEGSAEVKTSDGYTLRIFAIAFTTKKSGVCFLFYFPFLITKCIALQMIKKLLLQNRFR